MTLQPHTRVAVAILALAGVSISAAAARQTGGSWPPAVLGVLTAVALDLALAAYARWAYRRWREIYPPVSPTPET